MEKKTRILIFSDAHFSENSKIEEGRWYPPLEKILPEKIARKCLYRIDKVTQRCFYKMLNSAYDLGPFDLIIDLGDGTPGARQKGITTGKAISERLDYERIIDDHFPETEKRFVWGNHDAGFYSLATKILSLGSQTGHMSKDSYDCAERYIGKPWDKYESEKFMILFLNSEIIRASKRLNSPDLFFFRQKEQEQENFIDASLSNNSKKIILAIHDPSQLGFLLPNLAYCRKRISLTLAGHCHVLKPDQIRRKFPWGKEINFTKIIPNTWGGILDKFFGRKKKFGGFAILEISGSSFKLKHHWL